MTAATATQSKSPLAVLMAGGLGMALSPINEDEPAEEMAPTAGAEVATPA